MENDSITYLVRPALAEDINAPYLWLSTAPCVSRDIVRVVNKETSKSVWCEIVEAGDNFIERYNRNPRTKKVSKDIQDSLTDGSHVVTQILPLEKFFPAEQYHVNYYEMNADAPYCQIIIEPKIEKVKKRSDM